MKKGYIILRHSSKLQANQESNIYEGKDDIV